MAETRKQQDTVENVSHHDARSSTGAHSGQFGVSDERRAQLAQMEQDAGVQHEAADESVAQRPQREPSFASLPGEPGAARPGDKH